MNTRLIAQSGAWIFCRHEVRGFRYSKTLLAGDAEPEDILVKFELPADSGKVRNPGMRALYMMNITKSPPDHASEPFSGSA